MSLSDNWKVLYNLTLNPIRGDTHQQRMESLYAGQADAYDAFRKRILHGREDLYRKLSVPRDGVWVEMGAGTGYNLELLGDRIHGLKRVHLVDLCPSLLRIADDRVKRFGWSNAVTHLQDATAFNPAEPADVVTFSYSLTMIPEWYLAINNAWRILRPGGTVAVVDYYVSRNHPSKGMVRHDWWTRRFGPTMFSRNNVHFSPDHLPTFRIIS